MEILTSNSVSQKCNGRLGKYFKLKLITRLAYIDEINSNRLYYSLLIDRILELKEFFLYNKNQTLVSVKLNGTVIDKETVDIDFMSNQEGYILMSGFIDIHRIENASMSVECSLSFTDNPSKYLDNTSIIGLVHILNKKEDKLISSLSITDENETTVSFIIDSSIKPDRFEFKVNENEWRLLDGNKFNVAKLSKKKQYVQARVKKDNKYAFSNVITINSSDV